MALSSSSMKAKMQSRIYNGLQRVFTDDANIGNGYPAEAQLLWQQMADAISDIAMDIVDEITSTAEVDPGQQVTGETSSGSAVVGSTVSPGKIS